MPVFDLKAFTAQPSVEALRDLRKQDWLELVEYYQLDCSARERKEVIKNLVVDTLVCMGVLPSEAIDELTPGTSSGNMTPRLLAAEGIESLLPPMEAVQRKLSLEKQSPQKEEETQKLTQQQLDYNLQIRKMELEMKREELRAQQELRLRELELKELQIKQELEIKGKELQTQENISTLKTRFNASEASSLLPPFDETNVDGYFTTFESLAGIKEWPRDQWLIILYPKFVGKAQRVFNTLEQFQDYDTVKASIISAYEITPEAYRQRFRNLTKQLAHTFIEFATEKKRLLKKWMDSTHTSTLDDLVNLIILEELKSKMPQNILRHVEEKGATTWEKSS